MLSPFTYAAYMTISSHASEITTTLQEAGELAARLELPAGLPDRYWVSWALLRLSFDHARSIASLLEHHDIELAGSAFALLRPMNEALKRGTWFGLCATDEQTDRFIESGKLPGGADLTKDIERRPPFDKFRIFSGLHENASHKLHDFTHGGVQMAGAYVAGTDGIGSSYQASDVISVLNHAEGVGIQSVHVMVMVCGLLNAERAREVLAELEKVTAANQRLSHT